MILCARSSVDRASASGAESRWFEPSRAYQIITVCWLCQLSLLILLIILGGYMSKKPKYTCYEYREEMMLLGLKKRLNSENLKEGEKKALLKEIEELEKKMGMN